MHDPGRPEPTAATVAVLLAAGAGTRLGRGPKALLPHRGRPLVEHVVQVLLEGGCATVVVVLGAGADAVRADAALDRPGVRVVVNDDWATGMASSLRRGLAAAQDGTLGTVARVVVAHVDQPGVVPDDVARLLAAHRPGRVVASGWAGAVGQPRWGHPLVLDVTLVPAAAASAQGDRGARDLLRDRADLVDVVTHPGDGRDVDTEGDLDLLHPPPPPPR
ncbi:nucleotidyltransferase family protein [Cellulosimicrobium marinum]|uniref:nucleotidyltransferase family protein n=1 Tax=Cellulosimicrobium marinum TaxID=1638992 RepID=UPI001E640CE9|nr:nucleotidyltransferase family protein [Cellulosimicrobium marinum]MCB7136589.1 nucleotidyltransferase family protein [Cellulosimicrobium marinum]